MTDATPSAPAAARVDTVRSHHGDDVVDPYEWLRDPADPAVIAHLEAENAYAAAQTAHLEGLRGTIYDEIVARTQQTDLSVPSRRGAWWYYSRTTEGSQYTVSCRCPAEGPVEDPAGWTPPSIEPGVPASGEEVLVDGNAEAEGHAFFALGALSVSPDDHLLAYSVDLQGDERFTLRVKDLRTGEVLADEVPGVFYGASWSGDSGALYYTPGRGQWQRGDVVGEGPEQVALDRAQRAAAETQRIGRAAQVAAHDRQVARLDGDVGARSHGDADVGLRQCGSVVDAVAHHGHRRALALQPLDCGDLVGRQHLGDHVVGVDADLGRHRLAAVLRLSPVSSIVRRPNPRSRSTASRLVGFTTSATATTPRGAPSHPATIAVCPCRSDGRRPRRAPPATVPCYHEARPPGEQSSPSSTPVTPSPGRFWKSLGDASSSPCTSAPTARWLGPRGARSRLPATQ